MLATILTTVGPALFASLWIVSGVAMGAVSFGFIDA
jgi:hypothetical protein